MAVFQWDKSFDTGLKTVDEQHRGLVALINKLSDLVERGVAFSAPEMEPLCGELSAYTRYHFEEEGQLMQDAGLDPRHLEAHHREHEGFLMEVRRIRQGKDPSLEGARELLRFLTYWLSYHILNLDQSMAHQMAAIRNGAQASEAYAAIQIQGEIASSPLLKSLNILFEIVSQRNLQLYEMNQSLEAKVAERTRDLAEANENLREAFERIKAEHEETLRLSQELTAANGQLETLAMTDALTGLFNRRYAMDRLVAELSSARRHGEPLSLVVMDADGFKGVNDTFGHDAGDAVIRTLGTALKQLFRATDVVCRMGGDEFLVLCPRSDTDAAYLVAERARATVAAMDVAAGAGIWKGSLSIGVATLGPGAENGEALIKAADTALYEAKRRGRNRVVVFGGAEV